LLTFHTDPGHGWLEVPVNMIKLLGIADKISEFSYRRADKVYLEEDCDLPVFLEAMRNQLGSTPTWIERFTENTPIRTYARYMYWTL